MRKTERSKLIYVNASDNIKCKRKPIARREIRLNSITKTP